MEDEKKRKDKRTYSDRKEYLAAWSKARRDRCHAAGICVHCYTRKAEPFTFECKICTERRAIKFSYSKKKMKDKWEKEGKCRICGNKMHSEMDSGRKTCLTCRQRRSNAWNC